MTVQDKKDIAMVFSALVMLVWAALLTTAGFIIPPSGEVHDSVLWVLGQAFLYAGGIFGVREASKVAARRELDKRIQEYRDAGQDIGNLAETTDEPDNTEEGAP